MMMNKQYFVGLLISLCIIGACKKKPQSTPVDAEVKKYFSYKPGTYWIYKDSLTGKLDSFAVTNNNTKIEQGNSGNYDIELSTVTIFNNNDQIGVCEWTLRLNSVGFNYGQLHAIFGFLYPLPSVGKEFTANIDTYSIKSIYPTYIIGGNTFDSIAEIYHAHNSNDGHYNATFYMSKSVGLIKMRFKNFDDSTISNRELSRCTVIH